MKYRRITNRFDLYKAIELWNREHHNFQIINRLVEQNIFFPFQGVYVQAWGVFDGKCLKGFTLVKYLTQPIPHSAGINQGWISLLVIPNDLSDREIVGIELLNQVENDLKVRGITTVRFGGDPQNFLAGLPEELAKDYLPILKKLGYEEKGNEYDLYANLDEFIPPDRVTLMEQEYGSMLEARPVVKEEEQVLLDFLQENFPGRWFFEADNIRRIPGGVEEYWLLWYKSRPVGFARTNTSLSAYMGPNVNWGNRWGNSYAGLGPIGISKDFRRKGGGLYLMTRIIQSFKKKGFNHMMIDWTGLVDYYRKLGFRPVIKYITLYHCI